MTPQQFEVLQFEKWGEIWFIPTYKRNEIDKDISFLLSIGFLDKEDIENMSYFQKRQLVKEVWKLDGLNGYERTTSLQG